MKKTLIIVLSLVLFFGLSAPALGINDNTIAHKEKRPQLEMTPEQKNKVIQLKTELLELEKQIIKDNLKDNKITQDQANHFEEKINKKLERLKAGELGPSHHRKHSPES